MVAGIAAAGGGPFADAGLDQSVTSGTTVQLDATGSTHPDGEIESYEWQIETPDGRTISPTCSECGRTTFTPNTPGRYEVTVIVTGADGKTARDTLYVKLDPAPTSGRDMTDDSGTGSEQDTIDSSNTERDSTPEAAVENNEELAPLGFEPPIETNSCNGISQTRTGYVSTSIEECIDVGGVEWDQPESRAETAEIRIELSNYESNSLFTTSPPPNHDVPESTTPSGESNPMATWARSAQAANTGTVEGILYGADSAQVTQVQLSGEGAEGVSNLEDANSEFYNPTPQTGSEHGYQNVQQTGGPTDVSEYDTVTVTYETDEGTGTLDYLGISGVYSREDYEDDRSVVSDISDSIDSSVSDVVKSASSLSVDDDETNNEPVSVASTTTPAGTTSSNDRSTDSSDGPSSNGISNPDHNDGPTQDDSGDRGVGYSSGSSSDGSSVTKGDSSDDSTGGSSGGMDWQLPDDLGDTGSENSSGYATSPGI